MSDNLSSVSRFIGERGCAIVKAMSSDWGYPFAMLAERSDLKKTQVRRSMRTLKLQGLVTLQTIWDEDEGTIRGSAYFLTNKGQDLKEFLNA